MSYYNTIQLRKTQKNYCTFTTCYKYNETSAFIMEKTWINLMEISHRLFADNLKITHWKLKKMCDVN